MNINQFYTYFPSTFGEQAVQSALYSLARVHTNFEIVFFDPPGGAWTKFEIRDSNGELYRWDNIPKNPPKKFKRPDLILQRNTSQNIDLLVFESKGGPAEEDSNIAAMLNGFICNDPSQKSCNFYGIRNRPTHHILRDGSWKSIIDSGESIQWTLDSQAPTNPIRDRFWLSSVTVNIETCYAFEITDGNVVSSLDQAADRYDVNLVIGIQFNNGKNSIQVYMRKTSSSSRIVDEYSAELDKFTFSQFV